MIHTTYYVRDVAGQVMAVYSDVGGNLVLTEQSIYGAGRVGIAYTGWNNSKTYVYELTDHLGNVRVVFTKSGGNVQLEGYTDYYPFGMPMPNRGLMNAYGYRYAFQGQEKDPETGKEAFELRLWDGRIGRWLTTDPYGQYDSPYLGMGNNPISLSDSDGGYAEENPIYGSDGTFRGVDEYGLDGEAIIFDGDFTNGMAQSDILGAGGQFLSNFTLNNPGFLDTQAGLDIVSNWIDLPNRVDLKGYFTYAEGVDHLLKNGAVAPDLYYNSAHAPDIGLISELMFSFTDQEKYVNFLYSSSSRDMQLIFGNNKVKYLGNGQVRLGNDDFDYNYHDYQGNIFQRAITGIRNLGIKQSHIRYGIDESYKFKIHSYGAKSIPKLPPVRY